MSGNAATRRSPSSSSRWQNTSTCGWRRLHPASWRSPPSAVTGRTSSASFRRWATTSSPSCGRNTSEISTQSCEKSSALKRKSHSPSTPLRACTRRCAASSLMPWRVAFFRITRLFWRTYRYTGRKCEKKIADEETAQKIIAALEGESIKYETYFKAPHRHGNAAGRVLRIEVVRH